MIARLSILFGAIGSELILLNLTDMGPTMKKISVISSKFKRSYTKLALGIFFSLMFLPSIDHLQVKCLPLLVHIYLLPPIS